MNRKLFWSKSLLAAAIALLALGSVGLVWLAENLHRPNAAEESSVSPPARRVQTGRKTISSLKDQSNQWLVFVEPTDVENSDPYLDSPGESVEEQIALRSPSHEFEPIRPVSSESESAELSRVCDLPPVDEVDEIESPANGASSALLEDLPIVLER